MQRRELVSSLKELSSLYQLRTQYDNQIQSLRNEQTKVNSKAKDVYVHTEAASNAQKFLGQVYQKSTRTIKWIKCLVWIVSLAISFSIVGLAVSNAPAKAEIPPMPLLVLMAGAISVFCIGRLRKGGSGCLLWLFGIGCGLETIGFAIAGIVQNGLAYAIYVLPVVLSLLAIFFAIDSYAWETKLKDAQKKKAMQTRDYKIALEKDQGIEYANRARMQKALDNSMSSAKTSSKKIDKKIEELEALRNQVDAKLLLNDLFPYRDMYLIDRVIDKIENMRASTVEDALRECDRENRETSRYQTDMFIRQMERDRDRQIQERANEEAKWNQYHHNKAVEKYQKEQADELRAIREKLENK